MLRLPLALGALVIAGSGGVNARKRSPTMTPKHTTSLTTQAQFDEWIKAQVDAKRTAFVRWIHSTS